MARCVVIQPFDGGGRFDKRYEDVYEPAILAAKLEAYRVDRDPTASKPVDAVEAELRNADACLADITHDNPNVWYELGFAVACGCPVVMVCSLEERTGKKYPFDIQHRSIIEYAGHSPRDFDKLRDQITARLTAASKQNATFRAIAAADPVAKVDGLSNPEMVALAALAGIYSYPYSTVPVHSARNRAERTGLTAVGFNLALRRLTAKRFLEFGKEYDERDGESYDVVTLTQDAWEWIDSNDDRFQLHREAPAEDDTVPF